jgi:hypothetical protein
MNIKLIAIPAIALAAGLGLAACGSSTSPAAHNNAVVSQARQDQATVSHLTTELNQRLHTYTVYGTPGTFNVPGGQCSLGIIVPPDGASAYASDSWTLLAPNGSAVKVIPYDGTPESACLQAVKDALSTTH